MIRPTAWDWSSSSGYFAEPDLHERTLGTAADGARFRAIPSAEDLVVHKVFAERELDWRDVERIEFVKKAPRQAVLDWMTAQREESLFISVLSIGELEQGIARMPASDRRSGRLRDWLDHRVLPRFRARILPLDLEVLREWGRRSACRGRADRRRT